MSQQDSSLALPGGYNSISVHFWARKLHSLTGIFPIGVFLLEHLWTNSFALYGPQAFNEVVEKLQSLPYIVVAEIGLIAVPILYHAIYGIMISFSARPNQFTFPYVRNWMYTLQRLSGIILVLYIGLHAYETRISTIINGSTITFEAMVQTLSRPPVFAFYLLGVLAAVFHFANGLWAFLIGWGITTTERSMRLSAYCCLAVGVVLSLVGVNSLLGFVGKGLVIHF